MYATTTKGKILAGLFWGTCMFIFMFLVFPYHESGHQYKWEEAPLYLAYWCIGGIAYSYTSAYLTSWFEKRNSLDEKKIQ